jgi:hypothetical protein
MYVSWVDLHLREPLSENSSLGEPRKEVDGDAAARRSSRSQEVGDNLLPAGDALPCCSALCYLSYGGVRYGGRLWRSASRHRARWNPLLLIGFLSPPI